MPFIIALCVFVFLVIVFMPATYVEENIVRRRLINTPETREVKETFSIRRLTPMMIHVMSLFRMKISQKRRRTIQENLQLAGQDEKFTAEDFVAFKFLLGILLPLYLIILWLINQGTMMLYLTIITIPIGYLAPDQWLKTKIRQRQAMIKKELPYMLNGISIMSEAGLNLVPALQEFAKKEKSVLAYEIQRVVQDISVGHSQVTALERMAERCQVYEINRFVSALSQSIERGSSGITNVLKDQAQEVWETRKKDAQHLGEQASMKLFLPLLILALPATAIFILGPAIITIIDFLLNY